MKPSDRQKMCTQCDGRIPIEAQECPYCSAEQLEQAQEADLFSNHQSLQASLNSLYSPLYPTKPPGTSIASVQADSLKKPESSAYKEVSSKGPQMPQEGIVAEQPAQDKNYFLPILTLSLAANFLVLGLLQCFFSDNGKLTMEWDSNYWFIYLLSSIPLFFFGYKKLKTHHDKKSMP